jgi:hypothetical protein
LFSAIMRGNKSFIFLILNKTCVQLFQKL